MAAKRIREFDFSEPVLGLRMTTKHFVVLLIDRAIYFKYGASSDSDSLSPVFTEGIYHTANNPYALACVSSNMMVLPGVTPGQVQVTNLSVNKKTEIIRAHTSPLRQMALSKDGTTLATASEVGTIIRVFSVATLSTTHEFRRGVDPAITYSISISPSKHFVATTSDKGTLHIFDLRPASDSAPTRPNTTTANQSQQKRSDAFSKAPNPRPRPLSTDLDAYPQPSASSTPRRSTPTQQSYNHQNYAQQQPALMPPPELKHTPPSHAPSALAALAKLPGMPRAFSDTRSMTSTRYHLGSADPRAPWQGQAAWTATTLPSGLRTSVRNANVPLPGAPDGRAPRGVLAWDLDQAAGGGAMRDRRIWCLSGGADARWEEFELVPEAVDGAGRAGGRFALVRTGYRRFLTRQFAEDA